jgi:hypothetical protein
MVKEALKWGLVAVVVLIAWRYLSGALSGILGGAGGQANPVGGIPTPSAYYYPGVYGPLAIPSYGGDPFYSSPMGGGGGQGWGGSWPGGPRPRPLGN